MGNIIVKPCPKCGRSAKISGERDCVCKLTLNSAPPPAPKPLKKEGTS